eukprot:1151249-Pelagomonas_calceolata.AAC.1
MLAQKGMVVAIMDELQLLVLSPVHTLLRLGGSASSIADSEGLLVYNKGLTFLRLNCPSGTWLSGAL